MRRYEKGDKVLFGDDEIGTVLERYDQAYKLPEGQAIGGAPGATHGGHAHYRVKGPDGEIHELRDQDVRNPPKDSGHFTPYDGDPQVAGTEWESPEARKARKAENRARAAEAKEGKKSGPKRVK